MEDFRKFHAIFKNSKSFKSLFKTFGNSWKRLGKLWKTSENHLKIIINSSEEFKNLWEKIYSETVQKDSRICLEKIENF